MLDFVNRSLRKVDMGATNYEAIRANRKVLLNVPFNSTTKKMTVVVELERDKTVRVFTKGASECIIDDCVSMVAKDGQTVELDSTARE
jgi:Ca2+ transporting ATPase